MPLLKNPKHERFAQEIAKGVDAAEAYVTAGFKANPGNARRLKQNEAVRKRVEAILSVRAAVDAQATERAVERLSITKERVLAELAKIGFADITKAVRWGDAVGITDPETGEVKVANGVALVNSDDLPADVTAAIAEVSQTQHGVRIKFHDKRAALVDLGKHLGLFIERVEHGQPGDFERMDDAALLQAVTAEAQALAMPIGKKGNGAANGTKH